MCLMKAHPNVLAPDVTNSISNRPDMSGLGFLAHLSVCLDPPSPPLLALGGTALDRAAPFARVGDGFIVFVKPRERVWSWSFVSTRRFVQLYLSFFPSTWDIPCFRSFSSFSSSSHLPCLLSSFISLVLPTFPPLPPSHSSSSSHSSPLVPFHPPFVSSHLSNQSLTTTFLMCLTPRSSERGIEPVPPDFLVEDASRPAAIRNNRQDPLLHVSVKGMEHLVHTAAGH